MGAVLSLAGKWGSSSEYSEVPQNETFKRQRMSSGFNDENPRLISSLPDEISMQILARVPRICYLSMKSVSRSWNIAMTSRELFNLRKELGTTEEWLYILTKVDDDKLLWYALDPLSRKWQALPPIPNFAYEEESKNGFSSNRMWNVFGSSIKIADIIRGWLGRKDGLDRTPFCGCAIGAVDGCLYVLGGFSRSSAMKCVWRFDPVLNVWSEVSSMSIGRAYCKTAILNNKLYVVGGVSRGLGGAITPLQSAEMFDPHTGGWLQVPSMPFSRAEVLPTAFLADMLKPIATGMASYRGRLCVAQSLYSWPFFVDIGGEIYDPEMDSWVEMPIGMGEGWPARQAGTKLSVVVDGELYALDPSSSLDSGKIKMYDHQEDAWKVVVGKVPIRDFTDSESPYLLAGFLGKLHVITKDANHEIAVLQAGLHDQVSSSPSTSSSLERTVGASSTACDSSMPSDVLPMTTVESAYQQCDSMAQAETVDWKLIATRNFGSAELVSCQVLDI
ncbi:hypothetical protein NE237_028257 [Protea cynaroides]|uniref:F-box domain-containing protein n=1 Tax=Protea cynaroides TaxID=273540 RepID=A0A9Q0JUY9_9MAGN|nr:hypothetical protein NE237_028257 [Protea cynaroides]